MKLLSLLSLAFLYCFNIFCVEIKPANDEDIVYLSAFEQKCLGKLLRGKGNLYLSDTRRLLLMLTVYEDCPFNMVGVENPDNFYDKKKYSKCGATLEELQMWVQYAKNRKQDRFNSFSME